MLVQCWQEKCLPPHTKHDNCTKHCYQVNENIPILGMNFVKDITHTVSDLKINGKKYTFNKKNILWSLEYGMYENRLNDFV
jgi:hypothetical protein